MSDKCELRSKFAAGVEPDDIPESCRECIGQVNGGEPADTDPLVERGLADISESLVSLPLGWRKYHRNEVDYDSYGSMVGGTENLAYFVCQKSLWGKTAQCLGTSFEHEVTTKIIRWP